MSNARSNKPALKATAGLALVLSIMGTSVPARADGDQTGDPPPPSASDYVPEPPTYEPSSDQPADGAAQSPDQQQAADPAPPAAAQPAAVNSEPLPPSRPDYYTERAKKIVEEDAKEEGKPHPLQEAHPNDNVVVCEGGCPSEKGAQIVFIEPRSARKPIAEGEMVPSSSEASAPSAPSTVTCEAGCYDNMPRSYAGVPGGVATGVADAALSASANSASWVTTVTPAAADAAKPAKVTGAKPHHGDGGSGEWMNRISRETGQSAPAMTKKPAVKTAEAKPVVVAAEPPATQSSAPQKTDIEVAKSEPAIPAPQPAAQSQPTAAPSFAEAPPAVTAQVPVVSASAPEVQASAAQPPVVEPPAVVPAAVTPPSAQAAAAEPVVAQPVAETMPPVPDVVPAKPVASEPVVEAAAKPAETSQPSPVVAAPAAEIAPAAAVVAASPAPEAAKPSTIGAEPAPAKEAVVEIAKPAITIGEAQPPVTPSVINPNAAQETVVASAPTEAPVSKVESLPAAVAEAPAQTPAVAIPAAATTPSEPAKVAPVQVAELTKPETAAPESKPPVVSGTHGDPVVNVETTDSEMAGAITKARANLPEFWAKLENPGAGESDFSLKVAIEGRNASEVEHFWLTNISRKDGHISGTISNDPSTVKTVHRGQLYDVNPDKISDWLYKRNGKMVGNETMRPLLKRLPAQQAASYREMYETP